MRQARDAGGLRDVETVRRAADLPQAPTVTVSGVVLGVHVLLALGGPACPGLAAGRIPATRAFARRDEYTQQEPPVVRLVPAPVAPAVKIM